MGIDHEAIAAELDRYVAVPTDVLTDVATRDGRCMTAYEDGEGPEWTGLDIADRALARRLCGGCPVWRECLELELRTAGPATVGVWGALAEDDRRAVHERWAVRRSARRGDA